MQKQQGNQENSILKFQANKNLSFLHFFPSNIYGRKYVIENNKAVIYNTLLGNQKAYGKDENGWT